MEEERKRARVDVTGARELQVKELRGYEDLLLTLDLAYSDLRRQDRGREPFFSFRNTF